MKKNKLIIALAILLGITSCDILDTSPTHQVSTNNMWSNEALTNQGVAGVYQAMRKWGTKGTAGGSYEFVHMIAFEPLGVSGEMAHPLNYLRGTANADFGLFSQMWKNLFEGVHRANNAIYNLPSAKGIDDKTRARLMAECKFLRAYFYTRFNELYGRNGLGVPIYTEPVTYDKANRVQSSEAEVWALVEQDLTDCINEENFPKRYTESGRASKGAAYALRGRVRLIQGKYADASKDFEQVSTCGYNLFQGGYKQLFTEENEACEEMIFSLQNIAKPGYGSIVQQYYGTRSAGDQTSGNGWNGQMVSPIVVDLYENKDGSPFKWEDVIPGYTSMSVKDRMVYLLRDTLDTEGKGFHPSVTKAVSSELGSVSSVAKNKYQPLGNEERIKAAYANRDPRLAFNVITPYSDFFGHDDNLRKKNKPYTVNVTWRWPLLANNLQPSSNPAGMNDMAIDGIKYCHYWHRKFVMEGNDCIYRADAPIDEPIIRYAHVLLMWAEALAQQGKFAEAAEKVNLVRGRNTVEMPPYTFTSKGDAMEKIQNESRREFVGEGVNFFEEFRWGNYKEVKYLHINTDSRLGDKTASIYYNDGIQCHRPTGEQGQGYSSAVSFWSDKNDYSIWPVPQTEAERNPAMTKTPGWIY